MNRLFGKPNQPAQQPVPVQQQPVQQPVQQQPPPNLGLESEKVNLK